MLISTGPACEQDTISLLERRKVGDSGGLSPEGAGGAGENAEADAGFGEAGASGRPDEHAGAAATGGSASDDLPSGGAGSYSSAEDPDVCAWRCAGLYLKCKVPAMVCVACLDDEHCRPFNYTRPRCIKNRCYHACTTDSMCSANKECDAQLDVCVCRPGADCSF